MKFVVTRGLNSNTALTNIAQKWADLLETSYVERTWYPNLEDMLAGEEAEGILIATMEGPQIFTEEGLLKYHPGMAVLRAHKLELGEKDNFVTACGLQPGMKFLDCTLGLGGDAAIASLVVGKTGQVEALEASKPLWLLTAAGLATYVCADPELTAALRRISTQRAQADIYLRSLSKNSFDVVYFDPMFKRPIKASSGMQPLRPVAFKEPLTREVLEEALRVAPTVVVKEHSHKVLKDLGFTEIQGTKTGSINYGILRRNNVC